MKNSRGNLAASLIVLLGAASYGVMSTLVKFAMEGGYATAHITFQQVLSGTVLLWLAVLFRSRRGTGLRAAWRTWAQLSAIGVIGLALTTVFYNEALSRMNASLAIVLLFQFTWITILLEGIRLRKWPSRQEWLAIVLVLAGTVLAVGVLEQDIGAIDLLGVAYGLSSALTYSLFLWLTGLVKTSMDPAAKSAVMSTASLVFVMLMHTPTGFEWHGSLPLFGWGLLLGLFGTALPAICMNVGIPKIGSNLTALLGSLELPVAMIAAYFLLGEPLGWLQGLGVLLILVGIVAAQGRDAAPEGADAGRKPGEAEE